MSQTWIEQLNDARACGLAGVILSFNTSDRVFIGEVGDGPMSLKYFLASKFHPAGQHVGHFSLSNGFSVLTPPGEKKQGIPPLETLQRLKSDDLAALFKEMGCVLKNPKSQCTIIIEYASHIVPGARDGGAGLENNRLIPLEMLYEWSLDDDIRRAGNFLILINHTDALHGLIEHQGGFRPIQIGLPEADVRKSFANYLLGLGETSPIPIGHLAEDLSLDELTRQTNGLRLSDIEELFRQGAAWNEDITRTQVRARKKQTIHQLCGGLLEVAEPSEGFEAVAGCDHAKGYFKAIKPLWGRGDKGLPQAVLLAGVPGGGKSFLVKAVAKEFDSPCLIMRGVREMWVGQSERNLDRILQVVDDLAPCILWTDEIDQTAGGERSAGGSGDSGTNDRLLGRLLEFFGDSKIRGRVLWIATTNRPDLLDVAIKDRFSVKIPFLHPNRRERAELFPVLAGQIGRRLAADVDNEALAARPELETLTVRALQEVIVWAGTLADLEVGTSKNEITARHLERAIQDYKPTFDPLEHEMIALISLQMTSFTSLMPWMRLNKHFDPVHAEWPAYLDGLVDAQTGRIDTDKLERRIAEIKQIRMGQRI